MNWRILKFFSFLVRLWNHKLKKKVLIIYVIPNPKQMPPELWESSCKAMKIIEHKFGDESEHNNSIYLTVAAFQSNFQNVKFEMKYLR